MDILDEIGKFLETGSWYDVEFIMQARAEAAKIAAEGPCPITLDELIERLRVLASEDEI